jgi:hypothetical protein
MATLLERWLPRKERCGVAVCADAEQRHFEQRPLPSEALRAIEALEHGFVRSGRLLW